ncbi:MAG TPA: hypothetical protein ENN19_17520 [Chloroflexi bacterium]|nr:hypothetical protein [Chloroflexota bacterium]
MKHKSDVREVINMAVCAILSLTAFLALVLLLENGLLPALLVLIISLACPVVWLALLWDSGGKGLGQQKRRQRVESTATSQQEQLALT